MRKLVKHALQRGHVKARLGQPPENASQRLIAVLVPLLHFRSRADLRAACAALFSSVFFATQFPLFSHGRPRPWAPVSWLLAGRPSGKGRSALGKFGPAGVAAAAGPLHGAPSLALEAAVCQWADLFTSGAPSRTTLRTPDPAPSGCIAAPG